MQGMQRLQENQFKLIGTTRSSKAKLIMTIWEINMSNPQTCRSSSNSQSLTSIVQMVVVALDQLKLPKSN